ncbi:PKD domain-containing protein [Candidatus Bipolaricaulota bacterium]
MRRRIVLGTLLAILCFALAAQGRSFTVVQAPNNMAFFTNETGIEVTRLVIIFSEEVEILSVIGIGADMALSSLQGPNAVLSGVVGPYGSVQVEWTPEGASVLAAVWRRAEALSIHSIDVLSPTARLILVSGESVFVSPEVCEVEFQFMALGSSDPDGTIVQYLWTWSNGASAEGQTVTRIFNCADESTASVTLTVVDDSGRSDSVTHSFTIEAGVVAPAV